MHRRNDGSGAVDRQLRWGDAHRGVSEIEDEPIFKRGGIDRPRIDAVDGWEGSLRQRDLVDVNACAPLFPKWLNHRSAAAVG